MKGQRDNKKNRQKEKRDKLIYSKNAFKIFFLKMSREEKKEKVKKIVTEQVENKYQAS